MGCSFNKKEIKLKVQSYNQDTNIYNNAILNKNAFDNENAALEMKEPKINIAKIEDDNDTTKTKSKTHKIVIFEDKTEKPNNNLVLKENVCSVNYKNLNIQMDNVDFIIKSSSHSSIKINEKKPTRLKSDLNTTIRIINSSTNSFNLKVNFIGKDSEKQMKLLINKFKENDLIDSAVYDEENQDNIYEVLDKGISFFNMLKEKKYIPSNLKNRNLIKSDLRLNSIVQHNFPFSYENRNKGKKFFVDSDQYFFTFNFLEGEKKLDHFKLTLTENNDLNACSENTIKINDSVVVLCFDYSDKDSFEQLVNILNNSDLSGLKLISLGIRNISKSRSSCYEVNEDYAKLVFKNLSIEFFSINNISDEKDNTDLEVSIDEVSLKKGNISPEEKELKNEEAIFLSMFILNIHT